MAAACARVAVPPGASLPSMPFRMPRSTAHASAVLAQSEHVPASGKAARLCVLPGLPGGAPEHNGELLARDAVHRREAVFAHALHNAALLRPRNGRGVPLPAGTCQEKLPPSAAGAAGSAPEDRGEHGTVQRSLGIEAVVADAIHVALLRHRADIGLRPSGGPCRGSGRRYVCRRSCPSWCTGRAGLRGSAHRPRGHSPPALWPCSLPCGSCGRRQGRFPSARGSSSVR